MFCEPPIHASADRRGEALLTTHRPSVSPSRLLERNGLSTRDATPRNATPRRLPSMSSCAFSGRRRLARARLGAAVSRRSATRVSRRAPLATRVFDLDAVLIAQLLAHAVGCHKVAIEARMQPGREQLIHLRASGPGSFKSFTAHSQLIQLIHPDTARGPVAPLTELAVRGDSATGDRAAG